MTDCQRTNFTTCNDHHMTPSLASSPEADIVNWTYPTHYRAAGPKQPIPRGAHTPSSSIGSSITCSSNSHAYHARSRSDFSTTSKNVDPSIVVARILEKDQANGTTYLARCIAKEKDKSKSKPYPPPRVESRRALLSMMNGTKAPMLLRGASTSSRIAIEGKRGQVVRVVAPPPVPKPSTAVNRYLHKELPPTPPSSTPSAQGHPTPSDNGTSSDKKMPVATTIPQTKPLNLALGASATGNVSTLAAKRLSRARARTNGGSLALSRFRAVPAPIRPPRINGPCAFNGPSSAHTSDDEDHIPEGDIEELVLGSPLHQKEKGGVMSPLGDLPITPLDIPVDWDDLEDRWTSPILGGFIDSSEEGGDSKAALEAFRQDVNELFAPSPSIDVRGSVQAGCGTEEDYLSNTGSEECDGMKREKRHGKVMVKKELKLRLNLDQSGKGYRKGESFLMMNSPLSPETAGLHASIVW